jgi:hypothetical protein
MKENGNDAAAADALAIQYQQANLSLVDRHREIFTPPSTWNGQERDWAERGFEVVFDLTGEMGFDRPELVRIHHSRLCRERCPRRADSQYLAVRGDSLQWTDADPEHARPRALSRPLRALTRDSTSTQSLRPAHLLVLRDEIPFLFIFCGPC